MFDIGCDSEEGIEPRGTQILDIDAPHHEDHVMQLRQFRVRCARIAQRLGASALRKAEIGGVVNYPARVGVFIINP